MNSYWFLETEKASLKLNDKLVGILCLPSCRHARISVSKNSRSMLALMKSHVYSMLVQFEIVLCGCKWADIVLFVLTEDEGERHNILIERAAFNEVFWKTLLPVLKRLQNLVLELLTRHVQRGVPLLPTGLHI